MFSLTAELPQQGAERHHSLSIQLPQASRQLTTEEYVRQVPKVPCQLTERVFINMSPNTRSNQSKHLSYLFNAKQSPDFACKNQIQNELTLEKRLYGPVRLHGHCVIHVFSNTTINSSRTVIELNIPPQTSFSHLHLVYEGLRHKLHIVIFNWLTPTSHALPVSTHLLI